MGGCLRGEKSVCQHLLHPSGQSFPMSSRFKVDIGASEFLLLKFPASSGFWNYLILPPLQLPSFLFLSLPHTEKHQDVFFKNKHYPSTSESSNVLIKVWDNRKNLKQCIVIANISLKTTFDSPKTSNLFPWWREKKIVLHTCLYDLVSCQNSQAPLFIPISFSCFPSPHSLPLHLQQSCYE